MADNTTLNLGSGGDTVRTVDKAGKKVQVVTIDLGGAGAESLVSGAFPVTGTFWQATQPVSGTFWQATQPVSIASMPSTPVTGTFWQATQPVSIAATVGVSGPLTDTELRASAVPVSGTFWQSTQPVSIASMPTTAVTGTFWQATQPVSIAGTVATSIASQPLPTGAATDASLTAHAQTFKAATPQTTLSGANAGVTLTIAAAGAGLFHYITRIRITNVNPTATAIAGSAVTLAYTSTNIPGSLAWTAGNALAAGAEKVVADEILSQPIKTSVANTATTIVAPAIGAGGLCRITVYYYPAA